jgi:hypothetical protein
MDAQLESMGRIRTLARWLRRTGATVDKYPKRHNMTVREIEEAKRFAVGMFPWPSRWTVRLYNAARQG